MKFCGLHYFLVEIFAIYATKPHTSRDSVSPICLLPRPLGRLSLVSAMSVCLLSYIPIPLINRPCVAGAVLQTPSSLIHSFIHKLSDPFPPTLQHIINRKP